MPVLFAVVLIIMGSFAMQLPAIIYVLENMGASISAATTVLSAYSLMQFLAGPQWGRLSDKFGRKPMLVGALLIGCLAYLAMYLYADTFPKLMVLMAMAGLAAGGLAVVFATVADLTTEENRTKGMGLVGASIGLAFVLGTALGGSIAGDTATSANLSAPALAAAVSCGLGVVLVLVFFKEPKVHQAEPALVQSGRLAAFGRIAKHSELLRLCLVILVFTTCLALMEPLMPIYINVHFGWGPIEMRNLFIFIGVILVIVQGGLVGPISKRIGDQRMLKGSLLVMATGLLVLAFLPLPEFVYVALLLTSIGSACFTASSLSIASQEAEDHEKGAIMGVAQSMQALGRFFGPLMAGVLFEFERSLPFLGGAIAIVILYGVVLQTLKPAKTS